MWCVWYVFFSDCISVVEGGRMQVLNECVLYGMYTFEVYFVVCSFWLRVVQYVG